VSLWEKILVFWVLASAMPKLIFLPMFRAMYRAMAATDAQEELDREWLAAYEQRQRPDDGPVRRRRRRRGPRPTRPRGPGGGRPPRHGAVALRHRTVERRPVRAVAR
jgi:hypothetical protein